MPSMPSEGRLLDPTLLLHEPRVAVLHPEGFVDDAGLATQYLTQPHWLDQDPEWVLIHTKLMEHHFLEEALRHERYPLLSAEHINWSAENPWLDVYMRAAEYATHVVALNDGRFPPMRDFLYSKERPKRPLKVLMV